MKPLALALLLTASVSAGSEPPRMPIPNDYENSIKIRWLNKPVAESKLLDDAEVLSTWQLINVGQAKGEMTLTQERAVSGKSSLRLRCATVGDQAVGESRYYGTASARRVVNGEDWLAWNRLSFWIYPDLPGFRVISMIVTFHNEGAQSVPDVYGKMGINYQIVENQKWNHIVWEIPNLPRDKVTGIDFSYRMQGKEPGAADTATLDIDKLELQKVQADHYEGWDVAAGEISFSHSGYQSGAAKTAFASDLTAKSFELINVKTGRPVLSKNVSSVNSKIGTFQVMDFSEVREPGTYMLRAGDRSTRSFPIGDQVWKSSIWKAINFFYVERCGFAVPGVHDICHRDWVLNHGDKKLIVNGGWHDAGDLSQSLGNTAEAAYAMYSLAERLGQRREDPALRARLIEEANWGLDWLLKVTFHDGFRPNFSTLDRWTDGILGTVDDVPARAGNNPSSNIAAAATEALASRVLKDSDPIHAAYALKQAEEDWGFAVAAIDHPQGPRRSANGTELAGHAAIAALELWQATGNKAYSDRAVQFGRMIVDSQQTEFLPGLSFPLAGFFYTDTDKTQILRYQHPSHEAAPLVALARLCELFPNHADWIKWYAAVTRYSEYYQKPMAQFTQPYGLLANSIFRDDEYLKIQEQGSRGMNRDSFRDQVLNGVKVGEHYYVRRFPVWFEFRGNNGTMLAENKAVSTAAQLRGSLSLASLAESNLEWIVGRNPFVQSLMWGEGYDYAPQYSAMSGDIVGSLPVGIQSHGNADAPYWPTENCHNWKEVWVHPTGRWMWILSDLAGAPIVEGIVDRGSGEPITFRDAAGTIKSVEADGSGRFRAPLPEGEYEIANGAQKLKKALLPGGTYFLDLTPDRNLDVMLTQGSDSNGAVTVRAIISGRGDHKIAIRADNLTVEKPEQTLSFKAGVPYTLVWRARITNRNAPWTAVVIPDGDLSQRQELTAALTGSESRK